MYIKLRFAITNFKRKTNENANVNETSIFDSCENICIFSASYRIARNARARPMKWMHNFKLISFVQICVYTFFCAFRRAVRHIAPSLRIAGGICRRRARIFNFRFELIVCSGSCTILKICDRTANEKKYVICLQMISDAKKSLADRWQILLFRVHWNTFLFCKKIKCERWAVYNANRRQRLEISANNVGNREKMSAKCNSNHLNLSANASQITTNYILILYSITHFINSKHISVQSVHKTIIPSKCLI